MNGVGKINAVCTASGSWSWKKEGRRDRDLKDVMCREYSRLVNKSVGV